MKPQMLFLWNEPISTTASLNSFQKAWRSRVRTWPIWSHCSDAALCVLTDIWPPSSNMHTLTALDLQTVCGATDSDIWFWIVSFILSDAADLSELLKVICNWALLYEVNSSWLQFLMYNTTPSCRYCVRIKRCPPKYTINVSGCQSAPKRKLRVCYSAPSLWRTSCLCIVLLCCTSCIFHCQVWYRALSLHYAPAVRVLDVWASSSPQATFASNSFLSCPSLLR